MWVVVVFFDIKILSLVYRRSYSESVIKFHIDVSKQTSQIHPEVEFFIYLFIFNLKMTGGWGVET